MPYLLKKKEKRIKQRKEGINEMNGKRNRERNWKERKEMKGGEGKEIKT